MWWVLTITFTDTFSFFLFFCKQTTDQSCVKLRYENSERHVFTHFQSTLPTTAAPPNLQTPYHTFIAPSTSLYTLYTRQNPPYLDSLTHTALEQPPAKTPQPPSIDLLSSTAHCHTTPQPSLPQIRPHTTPLSAQHTPLQPPLSQ